MARHVLTQEDRRKAGQRTSQMHSEGQTAGRYKLTTADQQRGADTRRRQRLCEQQGHIPQGTTPENGGGQLLPLCIRCGAVL